VGLFLLNLLPDEKLHQPVMSFSLNFKQLPQYYNNLIQQPFSRLSIQKKIICGYGLVLGIGVLGIAISTRSREERV
jgi:hypothetical protein